METHRAWGLAEGGLGLALTWPWLYWLESRNKAQSRVSGREVCSLEGGAKQSARGMSRPETEPQEQPEPKTYTL